MNITTTILLLLIIFIYIIIDIFIKINPKKQKSVYKIVLKKVGKPLKGVYYIEAKNKNQALNILKEKWSHKWDKIIDEKSKITDCFLLIKRNNKRF